MNWVRHFPLLALLLLTGCGIDPITLSTASTVATTAVGTVDAIVSRDTSQECSFMNLVDGDSYCRSRTVPNGRPPVNCFRTIGGVDCYVESDPYGLAESGNMRERPPLGVDPVPARTAQKNVAPTAAAPKTAALPQ